MRRKGPRESSFEIPASLYDDNNKTIFLSDSSQNLDKEHHSQVCGTKIDTYNSKSEKIELPIQFVAKKH